MGAPILPATAQPFAATGVSQAMEQQQVPDTRLWMAAFLALAVTMIVAALAWLAFGPPIL